jgi:hypothetical protein
MIPATAKGQWNLDTADRYIAEAYGGYHINALNGINVDAGIFLSYIGCSATTTSITGLISLPMFLPIRHGFSRAASPDFPHPHLKIEPWIINGWQSYGSSNPGRV